MRCSTVVSIIVGAVCLGSAVGLAAGSESPVGVWQTTISGADRGVTILTFSNDFSFTGYGISRDALGPFEIDGTWSFDRRNRLIGGYTEFIEAGSVSGRFVGNVDRRSRLSVKADTTDGRMRLSAPAPAAYPDLSGSWAASVRGRGVKALTSFGLVASTNMAGWFELTGSGISESGTFSLSGAVLVTSDNKVGAYTVSNFGTATETASFAGKLVSKGDRLLLVGQNKDHKKIAISAERTP